MAIKRIKCEIYNALFEVFLEEKEEKVKEFFKKNRNTVDDNTLKGWLSNYGTSVELKNDKTNASKFLIFINMFSPSTVAHECFHAVELLFDHVGIKLNDSSSEAWAYMLDWLVGQVMKIFKREVNKSY